MTKPTFLTYEKPLLTCMVQGEHPARVKELIARSREAGAEAAQSLLYRGESVGKVVMTVE